MKVAVLALANGLTAVREFYRPRPRLALARDIIKVRTAKAMLASGRMALPRSLGRSGAVPRRCIAMCRVDALLWQRAECQPPGDGSALPQGENDGTADLLE